MVVNFAVFEEWFVTRCISVLLVCFFLHQSLALGIILVLDYVMLVYISKGILLYCMLIAECNDAVNKRHVKVAAVTAAAVTAELFTVELTLLI